MFNLVTEFPVSPEFGDKPHKEYFEDFLDALGVPKESYAPPIEATNRQIRWFKDRYENYTLGDPVTAILAALGPGNELATDQRLRLMYNALKTHYGVSENGLAFFSVHINGVEGDHYEVIRKKLIERVPAQGELIEREANYAVSESAKFWTALHEMR